MSYNKEQLAFYSEQSEQSKLKRIESILEKVFTGENIEVDDLLAFINTYKIVPLAGIVEFLEQKGIEDFWKAMENSKDYNHTICGSVANCLSDAILSLGDEELTQRIISLVKQDSRARLYYDKRGMFFLKKIFLIRKGFLNI